MEPTPGDAATLAAAFTRIYGTQPCRFVHAPGRINLIGEHTDYNDGWVMPAAIALSAHVVTAPGVPRRLRLRSLQFSDAVDFDLDRATPALPRHHWASPLLGTAILLERAGRHLRGIDLLLTSEIPIGAGLSSSAAVQVAVALALESEGGMTPDRTPLALLCMQASHEFSGTRCGLMDFYIACFGRPNAVLVLDTRSLDTHWVPWPPRLCMLVCDTGVRHHHASGEYNRRRAECETAVHHLAQAAPHISSLRDVTLASLSQLQSNLPNAAQFARCRHVISENLRVGAAARALKHANFATLGRLLDASHLSLRDDFEVSCFELDLMVELCRRHRSIYGARMVGGGFGGCVLALTQTDDLDEIQSQISRAFVSATRITPSFWQFVPATGARVIEENVNGIHTSTPTL